MSNGAGESASQRIQGKRKLFRGNDFAYAVARMAVAQICESVEVNAYQESQSREGVRFSSFQESALETLTDVAVQYIQSIGKTAHLYANIAGRVDVNSLDIVQALEDLGSGVGFSGVSDTDRCLADSGVVKDIIRYTGEAEELPFVYSLPRFPFNKDKRRAPSFSEVGAEPPDEHIPVWLPAFPETKLCDRAEETNVGTIEGGIPCKENGSSLPSMQRSFDGGRLEILKSPKDARESTEAEVDGNPYLTAPLRFVEKDVSPVFRPLELSNEVVSINHVPDTHMSNNHVPDMHMSNNHVPDMHMSNNHAPDTHMSNNHVPDTHMSNNHHIPVLEASAPSDEINNKNRLAKSEDGEKIDGARTQRSLVRFKIGTMKRPTCLAINPSFQEQGWFQEGVVDKREKKSEIKEKPGRIDSQIVDSDVK